MYADEHEESRAKEEMLHRTLALVVLARRDERASVSQLAFRFSRMLFVRLMRRLRQRTATIASPKAPKVWQRALAFDSRRTHRQVHSAVSVASRRWYPTVFAIYIVALGTRIGISGESRDLLGR
jgi:hypothetical protein